MYTMKNLILACMLSVLAGCAGHPRKEPATALKIATWNMEHLAEADGMGCRARSETDYAQLRQYVARLDADVIAFEEVESAAAAARVFPPDQYTIAFSERPSRDRHSFCKRDAHEGPMIRSQHVGFAIRHGVKFVRNADLDALALGDPDLRWGVDITVEGPQPLRLLALHLKSGCAKGDSNEACPVLFQQIPVLAAWMSARTEEGVDFAMLGDWNRRMALPGDSVWKQLNESLPHGAALIDAANGRNATCIERYPDYIDHIVLNAGAAKRMAKDSFSEFSYAVAEEQYPSDHCPVSVIVR